MVDKLTNAFLDWCYRDTAAARFQRSIVQGVLAVLVVGITTGEWGASAVTGVIMAVLSPIQAAIGSKSSESQE